MSIKHRLAKLEQNSAALATPPHYYAIVGVQHGDDEDAKAADAIAHFRADHSLDESALVDVIVLQGCQAQADRGGRQMSIKPTGALMVRS